MERGRTDEACRQVSTNGCTGNRKRLRIHSEDALEGRGVDRAEVRRVDLVAVEELGQARGVPAVAAAHGLAGGEHHVGPAVVGPCAGVGPHPAAELGVRQHDGLLAAGVGADGVEKGRHRRAQLADSVDCVGA